MFNKNINIQYITTNNNADNKTINITKQIIPILTFLSACLTALMTASKFIFYKNLLIKNSIFNTSLIIINKSEIIANSFISIISSIFFVCALIQIKNIKKKEFKGIKKDNIKKRVGAITNITIGTILINYELLYKLKNETIYTIQLIIILLLISIVITYQSFKKIKIEDLKIDSILLGISVPISIAILPIIFSFFSLNIDNINFAKNKNNTTENFNKVAIYQTKDLSVLCNYNIEDNKIKPDCTTYEILNNTDIIFSNNSNN